MVLAILAEKGGATGNGVIDARQSFSIDIDLPFFVCGLTITTRT
jgi:hypothetical protein